MLPRELRHAARAAFSSRSSMECRSLSLSGRSMRQDARCIIARLDSSTRALCRCPSPPPAMALASDMALAVGRTESSTTDAMQHMRRLLHTPPGKGLPKRLAGRRGLQNDLTHLPSPRMSRSAARLEAPAPKRPGRLRIAVCIAGQLSRLEIASKIENVLKPTAATQPEALDLFLALEVGAQIYSNLDFGAILAQQVHNCGQLTESVARDHLAPYLAAASFTNHTTRSIDLSNWRRYRKDRPTAERLTRLQHHLSQFVHMRTCARMIEAHEITKGMHYDVVLKLRDNTIAVAPFAIRRQHAIGPVLTKDCVHWGGYNDKVMVLPRQWMDACLRAPSEDFFLVKDIGRGISNSERLLKAVLDRRGVRVQRVSPEAIPLVDGRCVSQGWCLVENGKDCRPATVPLRTKPCETYNMTATQQELYKQRFLPRKKIAPHLAAGVPMNDP